MKLSRRGFVAGLAALLPASIAAKFAPHAVITGIDYGAGDRTAIQVWSNWPAEPITAANFQNFQAMWDYIRIIDPKDTSSFIDVPRMRYLNMGSSENGPDDRVKS